MFPEVFDKLNKKREATTKCKFNVGDKVKVKEWEDLASACDEEDFGVVLPLDSMCGATAIVKSTRYCTCCKRNEIELSAWSRYAEHLDRFLCEDAFILVEPKSAQQIKEMTVAEIEAALGYRVKIISSTD